MAGQDELIYVVKFVPNEQSLGDIQKALADAEKKARTSKPKTKSAEHKEEIKALDDLTQRYMALTEGMAETNEQVRGYKLQLKELEAIRRSDAGLTLEQQDAEVALKAALRDTSADLNASMRSAVATGQVMEELGTSYDDTKKRMAELSMVIRSIDDPLGKNALKVQELTQEYNHLNSQLKEVDGAMGNHQRNVGDYENSIRGAANALAIFQGPLGPISGRLNSVATVLSRLSNAQKNTTETTVALTGVMRIKQVLMRSSIPLINTTATSNVVLGKSAMVANLGIKALNAGLWLLRKALIATGIGAILIAFAALVNHFRISEDGAERLRVRMAGFKAILDALKEVLLPIGEFLADMWDDPIQGAKDLGEMIAVNLWNRVKAIGDAFKSLGTIIKGTFTLNLDLVKDGFIDLTNAALQFTTGFEDVVDKVGEFAKGAQESKKQAEGLQEAMNAILRIERELGVERAQMNRDFQQAREFARDLNNSYTDRLDRLSQARKAQNELAERELSNENARLAVMEEQFGMFTSGTKEFDQLAEQREKIAKMEEESAQKNISLLRDITAVERQRDEFALRSLRQMLIESERATELRIAGVNREMTRRGEMVELAKIKENVFLDNMEKERLARFLAYQQEYLNQRFDADDAKRMAQQRADEELEIERLEFANNTADAIEQRERTRVNSQMAYERLARQRMFDDNIHDLQQSNDQIGILEQQRIFTLENQEREFQARVAEMKKGFIDNGIHETEAEAMARAQIASENAQEIEQIERNLSNARLNHQRAMMDGIIALTKNSMNALFGENKVTAIAAAIMDTYAGATKALASSPPPLNYINAAAVTAAGIANVRKIMATTRKSSTVDSSPPQINTQFGFTDVAKNNELTSMAVAQNTGMTSGNMSPTIVLEGDLNTELLAIKVREGNNAISGKTLSIGV